MNSPPYSSSEASLPPTYPPHAGFPTGMRSLLASTWQVLDQPPPPSLREILSAYKQKGDGDRDMLLAMLNAKAAEDQRIAALANLRRSTIDLSQSTDASLSNGPRHSPPSNSGTPQMYHNLIDQPSSSVTMVPSSALPPQHRSPHLAAYSHARRSPHAQPAHHMSPPTSTTHRRTAARNYPVPAPAPSSSGTGPYAQPNGRPRKRSYEETAYEPKSAHAYSPNGVSPNQSNGYSQIQSHNAHVRRRMANGHPPSPYPSASPAASAAASPATSGSTSGARPRATGASADSGKTVVVKDERERSYEYDDGPGMNGEGGAELDDAPDMDEHEHDELDLETEQDLDHDRSREHGERGTMAIGSLVHMGTKRASHVREREREPARRLTVSPH